MKSSSGESSESEDEETSQKGDFADFQSFQKLIKKEGSIDDTPVSIRSSISSDCNDSHQNLEDCFKEFIGVSEDVSWWHSREKSRLEFIF